ncbi:MAG: threonylcarbamoyl-AMP synthase [Leptospiraceae bacterium]|nr:threonylcarbamoyl-AMP synthase [Leptospiraceae bacterium]MCP5500861.1 threonylcarbamoyl-AMP synthase [Leptospiraceae bacterium]
MTEPLETLITTDPALAGNILANAGIVIFPTETVFGIGASAYNEEACRKIYTIKNRPKDNPFILHISNLDRIKELAILKPEHQELISVFSPGPITYILPKKDEKLFSSGLPTIGLRIPSNPLAQKMLEHSNLPIAAPSANLSGKPSITRWEDAREVFKGKVNAILIGEQSEIGMESTVINLSTSPPVLLRPGGISFEELKFYLPDLKLGAEINTELILSPGLKYKHYSPECVVIAVPKLPQIEELNAGQIGFELNVKMGLNLKINNNQEYMKNLYSFFIDCEKKGLEKIYCELPKNDNLKETIMNRLEKASEV